MMERKYLERVSVVIPFFKGKEWLAESIESVLSQTYKPYEILVINDGSEENIDSVIDKYKDQVTFFYQENAGAGAARNKGIKEATGDIVAFLDSDDLWDRKKLEVQVDAMIRGNYVWSATGYSTFGVGKRITVYPDKVEGLCWELLYDRCKIATPSVAVRKEVLDTNMFAEDMRKAQDIYLWFRLSNQYPLEVIEQDLVKFRKRKDSTVSSVANHIKGRSALWRKMNESNNLLRPKRFLTIQGYRICSFLDKNTKINMESVFVKLIFALAWAMFRVDSVVQEMGLGSWSRFLK